VEILIFTKENGGFFYYIFTVEIERMIIELGEVFFQVDLKLKVCRGESVRKTLVKEAKASNVAKLIVGTSKTRQKLNSSTSTAKYCAKKLSKGCSVYAVRSGKILFQREATVASNDPLQGFNCLVFWSFHVLDLFQ
jgi:K+-sensing histidine kinase KdpD